MKHDTEALLNYEDAHGLPICAVCGQAIQPTDAAGRPDGCIVHAHCLGLAKLKADPCEPTP
jgi:hypothetical protein